MRYTIKNKAIYVLFLLSTFGGSCLLKWCCVIERACPIVNLLWCFLYFITIWKVLCWFCMFFTSLKIFVFDFVASAKMLFLLHYLWECLHDSFHERSKTIKWLWVRVQLQSLLYTFAGLEIRDGQQSMTTEFYILTVENLLFVIKVTTHFFVTKVALKSVVIAGERLHT